MARIFILGAGNPVPSVDAFGSSYVIRIGDEHIMFDDAGDYHHQYYDYGHDCDCQHHHHYHHYDGDYDDYHYYYDYDYDYDYYYDCDDHYYDDY